MEDAFYKNFYRDLLEQSNRTLTEEDELSAADFAVEFHEQIFGLKMKDMKDLIE